MKNKTRWTGKKGEKNVAELEIGHRIKDRRQSNSLTLKQLSELVGCSDAYISQIENGRVSPSISTLKKIADALQSRITDFFVETPVEEPVVLRPDQRTMLTLDRWNAKIQSLVLNSRQQENAALLYDHTARRAVPTGFTSMLVKNSALCAQKGGIGDRVERDDLQGA